MTGVINSILLPFLFSCALVGAFFAWRRASALARDVTTRFRFYALRDKCVLLVVSGAIREDDELFQFFYRLCNSLAGGARRLDFRTFIQNMTQAILIDDNLDNIEERAREIAQTVKQRPDEFQRFVAEFYDAVQFSLIDSSTVVLCSAFCTHIPGLGGASRNLLLGLAAWHAMPVVVRNVLKKRRQMVTAYEFAGDVNATLQAV